MQKAAEDMKRQQEEETRIKHEEIQKRVPKLVLDGLNEGIDTVEGYGQIVLCFIHFCPSYMLCLCVFNPYSLIA